MSSFRDQNLSSHIIGSKEKTGEAGLRPAESRRTAQSTVSAASQASLFSEAFTVYDSPTSTALPQQIVVSNMCTLHPTILPPYPSKIHLTAKYSTSSSQKTGLPMQFLSFHLSSSCKHKAQDLKKGCFFSSLCLIQRYVLFDYMCRSFMPELLLSFPLCVCVCIFDNTINF
jgi:hypothetical protein